MKKPLTLVLAVALALSLTACGGGKSKKAFEASKEAYQNINAAYELTADYGSNIYEAWRLGIYDKDEIMDGGCSYLAKELNLSQEEVEAGAAHLVAEAFGASWDECTDEEKNSYKVMADSYFRGMEDNLFSWCVEVVSNTYIINGKAAEAKDHLEAAKGQMKELSESYSDYEHYPALKGYYTTTSSFFDFCQNPTGSFEQLKTTVEDYKTTARDFNADLDYIFED